MPEHQSYDAREVIQGGMGIWVSGDRLAGAVAAAGATGLVSVTAIGTVLQRRLQDGHIEVKKALETFPNQEVADELLDRYYSERGRQGKAYKPMPQFKYKEDRECQGIASALEVAGAYAAVCLAKQRSEGRGRIGINVMEELENTIPATMLGAMMAKVDVIAIGAGIPSGEKSNIKTLARGEHLSYPLSVMNATKKYSIELDPEYYTNGEYVVSDPDMLAIVSLDVLVKRLKSETIPPDGYVIEGPSAGGHNAPPRQKGAREYGNKDYADLEKIRAMEDENGNPIKFWLAGGYGSPKGLRRAKELGAQGVQAGTAFAFCEESGFRRDIKLDVVRRIQSGAEVVVRKDFDASPTGFPFNAIDIENSISEQEIYEARRRVCDLGYLRKPIEMPDGEVAYRCPAEPEASYLRKAGTIEETLGRKCLCNALAAAADMAQIRNNGEELPLVTAGENLVRDLRPLVENLQSDELYAAADVVRYLRGKPD